MRNESTPVTLAQDDEGASESASQQVRGIRRALDAIIYVNWAYELFDHAIIYVN